MKLTFDSNYTIIWLLIFISIAIVSSLLVYFRNRTNKELSKQQVLALSALRACGIFLLLLLFLNPVFISKTNRKEKPLLVVAIDQSQSILPYKSEVQHTIDALKDELERKYQLEYRMFGDKVFPGDTPSFQANQSDYGKLFSTISAEYFNHPPDAVILLGDGLFNAGANPLNAIQNIQFPIYSVGLGDTTRFTDLQIRAVKHPRTAFLDRMETIEADIQVEKMNGKSARIDLLHDNQLIESRTVIISSNTFFATEIFRVQASPVGLQKFSLRISSDPKEKNTANNIRDLVIQVTDNRHKILILSDGPHPDCGAIKSSLEDYGNYEVQMASPSALPNDWKTYNLFIWHQLPSSLSGNNQLLTEIAKSKLPMLIITGNNTAFPYLNNLQTGISTSTPNGINEAQFSINKSFTLFKNENEAMELLQMFPPLYVPATSFQFSEGIETLAFQKLKGVDSNQPLCALGTVKQQKVGFILGEGIWRWRLYDYRTNGNTQIIDELLNKIVNFLTLKENEEKLRLFYSPIYAENEAINIDAELYNDSYELVTEPEMSLLVKKDSLSEYKLVFDRTEGHYRINLGKPETGVYQIEATVTLGEQQYKKNGNFRVIRQNLEEQQITADHQLLYQLSSESGGQFFESSQVTALADSIRKNKHIQSRKTIQTKQHELIHLKWFFILLLLMFGLEWFLRKYWGIY